MNIKHYQSQLTGLLKQRNAFLTLSMALITLCMLLTGLCFYAFGHARTILVPPAIERPLWVSGARVSSEYLMEMTNFLLSLKLNVTPNSIDYQDTTLMRYVAPEYYDNFKTALAKEREQISNEDLTSVFYPALMQTDAKALQATVTGDLAVTIGNTHLPNKRVSYQLSYRYTGGRLLISEIKELTHA